MDEPRVREAKKQLASKMSEKQRNRYFPELPSFNQMVSNLENYDKQDHKLKLGSYVYLDRVPTAFAKSDEYKRGRVFFISDILRHENPLRFKLKGLLNPPEEIPGKLEKWKQMTFLIIFYLGSYYEPELRLVPDAARPDLTTFWKIDHIIKYRTITRKKKKVKQALVNWQSFPHSYDSWEDATGFVSASKAD